LQHAGVSDLTKQLAGNEGVPRIVPKNGIFRKLVNGEEMGKVTTGRINAVIVNASPHVSRVFYAKAWNAEDKPTAPECFSNNGRTPDPKATNPQHSNCNDCPKNIKGSGQGNSKACRYSRRLAVVLESDFNTALEGKIYQVNLASKSLFGDGVGDHSYTFENYTKYLASNGKSLDYLVTEMSFNENNDNQSLVFSPVRFITKDEYAVTSKAAASEEAKKVVTMTVYKADTAGRQAALENSAAKDSETTEEFEQVPEPTKREVSKPAVAEPAKKSGLESVVKAWSDEE
jgi:hypothetical protein